jgi:hypothetical protein
MTVSLSKEVPPMSDARVAFRRVVVVLLLVCCGSGALIAKKRQAPAYLDESFSPADVSEIAVLPAADLRKDLTIEVKNLHEVGRNVSGKLLAKRGYDYRPRTDFGRVASIDADDVEYMDPEWVDRLGNDEDRWILLLVLEDLVTKKGQAAFTARCSGYLFDRSAARAMWRHETTESLGSVGLGALTVKKVARRGTVSSCFEELLKTLPDR